MGENERLAQLDKRVRNEHRTRFGSEELSEGEKAGQVLLYDINWAMIMAGRRKRSNGAGI